MSGAVVTVILGMIGALFFTTIAIVLAVVMLVLGFRAMFERGAAAESLPTLLVMIPVLTLVGITILRLSHGSHLLQGFGHGSPHFFWLTSFVSIQLLFAILGLALMKRMNYSASFINGAKKSATSFALVCPGVAGFILLNFWVNKGLLPVMPAELFSKFDIAYFVLYAPIIFVQFKTVQLYGVLNRKLLKDEASVSMAGQTA